MKDFKTIIIKNIPFYSLFLVIIGNVYTYSYYGEFHINIYEFVELSEIFSIFLPHLHSIIITFFGSFGVSIFLSFIKNKNNKNKIETRFTKARNFYKVAHSNTYGYFILVLLIMTVLYFINWLKYNFNNFLLDYIILGLFFIFTGLLLLNLGISAYKKGVLRSFNICITIMLVFGIYFLTMLCGSYSARNLKNQGHKFYTTNFKYNDTLFQSSQKDIYIGATNKYVFIFHERKGDT